MKDLIRNIIRQYITEVNVRSTKDAEQRFEIVANEIIKYMDRFDMKYIPDYSFLANLKRQPEDKETPDFKNFLQHYLRSGEYDNFVKPMIQTRRPEFSFTKGRGRRHKVDEFVVVYSNGEKILYNTFNMNGIKLVPHPKEYQFDYTYDGEVRIKKPDFYWPEKNVLLEVAGLDDLSYNKDYMKKLKSAQEQAPIEMIIVDYLNYRKNLQGFYKYVCEKFGFPYDPMDFWTANISQGIDQKELRREAEELVKKGASKSFGERWRANKIITQLLTKEKGTESFQDKPEGYESVWDFKRETGVGMRWSDPELRKQVKEAWCKSSGSNMGTYEKFKELYKGVPFSKTMVETMKKKFPEDFNPKKRDEICKDYP